MEEARTDLPWLNLRSLSTGQSFRLFIRHGELLSAPVVGMFSTYGLSATATVPGSDKSQPHQLSGCGFFCETGIKIKRQ